MMEVKKYRAATTRAALEQIKLELGEDAFVLETRRVKTRSLFGFRSTPEIEISAAASAFSNETPVDKKKKPFSILNLRDDTLAAPHNSDRNFNEDKTPLKSPLENAEAKSLLPINGDRTNGIELSSEAPKLIHARKETAKKLPAERSPTSPANAEPSPTSVSSREFDILRAELREVKFSLGSITARKNVQGLQSEFEAERTMRVFDAPFYEAYLELTETGISGELARKMISGVIAAFEAGNIKSAELARFALQNFISAELTFESDPLKQSKPNVMAFIGATGVGKTTTIAKLAARIALHENRRVELVTLDTYRIAAVDQLKTYAEIIGAGCHVVRSVLELDALLRRLPEDSTVLIDTAGRSPHDLADQYELTEYLRLNKNIRKCLAIQATTHHFDAAAILKKFEMYGADCLVLTKLDETMYPGALLETILDSSLPLTYICNGQRVPEDLQLASAENLVSRFFGDRKIAAGH